MNKPLIECKHFPGKCFGCIQICGKYYCKVLDTEIKDHSCSFYKTQVEYDLQIPHQERYNPRIDDIINKWEEKDEQMNDNRFITMQTGKKVKMIWDHEVFRCDGNLFVYTRIQNEFTGNISGHFRRIYKDKNGYYAKADGKNNYLNGEVESFLKREAIQKESMEFYKNYKGRIFG